MPLSRFCGWLALCTYSPKNSQRNVKN
ncbi:hypothetical protein AGR6A_Lc90427 [Agrobacterium sp. NCPPB 925]|nr:hypothetical protein AGR6A_Lc90427 [Agrobacterium sp. NCPPB 925]